MPVRRSPQSIRRLDGSKFAIVLLLSVLAIVLFVTRSCQQQKQTLPPVVQLTPIPIFTAEAIVSAPVLVSPLTGATFNAGEVQLSGSAQPGYSIQARLDGRPLGTAVADAEGVWVLPARVSVAGEHVLSVEVLDELSQVVAAAEPISVTVASVAVRAPSLDTSLLAASLTTGAVMMQGEGEPGSTVQVLVEDRPLGQALVGPDGRWNFAADIRSPGVYAFALTAIDGSGRVQATATPVRLVIDPPAQAIAAAPPTATAAPTATALPTVTPAPTVTPIPTATPTPLPTDTPLPTVTSVPSDTPTPDPTATETLTATVTRTPAPTETASEAPTETPSAAPTGTATPEPTDTATSLPAATPTLSATETAAGTAASIATAEPTASATPTRTPTPTEATPAISSMQVSADSEAGTLLIAGSGATNSVVQLLLGAAPVATTTVNAAGSWSLSTTIDVAGVYTASVAVLESNGAPRTIATPFDIEIAATATPTRRPTAASEPTAATSTRTPTATAAPTETATASVMHGSTASATPIPTITPRPMATATGLPTATATDTPPRPTVAPLR